MRRELCWKATIDTQRYLGSQKYIYTERLVAGCWTHAVLRAESIARTKDKEFAEPSNVKCQVVGLERDGEVWVLE